MTAQAGEVVAEEECYLLLVKVQPGVVTVETSVVVPWEAETQNVFRMAREGDTKDKHKQPFQSHALRIP